MTTIEPKTAAQLQAEVGLLRQVIARRDALLLQCWYWFDDHDDMLTSSELHRRLQAFVIDFNRTPSEMPHNDEEGD